METRLNKGLIRNWIRSAPQLFHIQNNDFVWRQKLRKFFDVHSAEFQPKKECNLT